MRFIIDSNVFIDAKNKYYGFDVCPGFWKWLLVKHEEGLLFSIDKVKNDINQGNDTLQKWIQFETPQGFFLGTESITNFELNEIRTKLEQADIRHDKSNKIDDFMGCSDPYLIAYARMTDYGIITLEKGGINHREKIKIPGVCELFDVPHKTSIFDLLHADKPLFNFPYNKVSDVTVEYTTEEVANQYPPN